MQHIIYYGVQLWTGPKMCVHSWLHKVMSNYAFFHCSCTVLEFYIHGGNWFSSQVASPQEPITASYLSSIQIWTAFCPCWRNKSFTLLLFSVKRKVSVIKHFLVLFFFQHVCRVPLSYNLSCGSMEPSFQIYIIYFYYWWCSSSATFSAFNFIKKSFMYTEIELNTCNLYL